MAVEDLEKYVKGEKILVLPILVYYLSILTKSVCFIHTYFLQRGTSALPQIWAY